jgi:acyl dehydratase
MLDRNFIGHEFAPRFADVEKGQLKFFAKATGETNSIYFDEDAARGAGHKALPAPPTFQFSLELLAPDPQGPLGLLNVDIGKVLHGEQQFSFERQIYAGDTIKLVTRIVDIYDKKAGALEFIVQETIAENQNAEPVGKTRTVTVVRNG